MLKKIAIVVAAVALLGALRPPEREERTYAERTVQRGLELNSADSATLVAVPGIGPAFARGILKYREKLGGYHSLDQLAEVYVLKDKPDAVAKLKDRLVLDTLMMRQIGRAHV